MPAIVNVLVGMLQPAVPSLVAYGLAQGWFSSSTLGMVAAIAGAVAAAASSAVTTKVTTVNPPASPGK